MGLTRTSEQRHLAEHIALLIAMGRLGVASTAGQGSTADSMATLSTMDSTTDLTTASTTISSAAALVSVSVVSAGAGVGAGVGIRGGGAGAIHIIHTPIGVGTVTADMGMMTLGRTAQT